MKAKVGMVTIGQSPRRDVVPEMEAILGPGIRVVEAGALDGLSLKEVQGMAPGPGDYILVTLMRDGTPVKVSKRAILPRIQGCIERLVDEGVELIALLCTGEFPRFKSKKLVLKPDILLNRVVQGILPEGTLGVLVPSPDQIRQMRQKWEELGLEVVVESAMPYGMGDEVASAAKRLAAEPVDLIVLDCIGYTIAMKETVRRLTGKPTILPRSILARVIRELVSEGPEPAEAG
jgi:protein AroM